MMASVRRTNTLYTQDVPPLRSGKLEGSSWRSIKNISSNFNDICDRETEDGKDKDEELRSLV
jgi:hypothetical protein